jgi:hypothetical protein
MTLKGASEDWACPSVTLMLISMYSPTADDEGVPDRRPVEALNDAQGGRFAIEKLNGLPSGSEAAGVNE